jgi:N-acetylglucosaminyldiphosphoundecaprenol N-acetyl-beta-D-mannosaminyltransferase
MTGLETASSGRDRVSILGVPVDCVTMDETMECLANFLASDRPHLVVTADASGIAQAQSDPELMRLYREADLVTPDSIGVLWAARRAGHQIAAPVSGVEILDRVCRLSAERGHRIFFLGAEPGVAELAAERMRLRHPGCNIVGVRHGYFPPESDEVVAQEVAEFKPDILVVAMGIPRQEKFIRATAPIIRAKVGIGVGGSLDVYSGKARRAPRLVQRMRMEWFWRTALNPRKIKKARFLPRFVLLVVRSPRPRRDK